MKGAENAEHPTPNVERLIATARVASCFVERWALSVGRFFSSGGDAPRETMSSRTTCASVLGTGGAGHREFCNPEFSKAGITRLRAATARQADAGYNAAAQAVLNLGGC